MRMLKLKEIDKKMTDDFSTKKTFSIGTYVVLCLVSTVMTVMNIITHKGYLTLATGAFAVLCIVNVGLTLLSETANSIAKFLFATEVICMFTFFLVSGNPDGFSAIWICMLPSVSMLFFKRIKGTVFSGSMFVIMVFLLWIPYGRSLLRYNYNDTFKMRFPVLFIACYFLAFFMESRRESAYKEMCRLQDHYKYLSARDPLTNVFNRQGMYSAFKQNPNYSNASKIYTVIFDIDFFKSVNDRYGHDVGDTVLKEFTAILLSKLDAIVCRWGGEEFVAVFTEADFGKEILENVTEEFRERIFCSDGEEFNVTVSAGVSFAEKAGFDALDSLISKADDALYEAKKTGRNKIVYYEEINK